MSDAPKTNRESNTDFSSLVESVYPLLDMFLGLNEKVKAALASDPDLAKATYARVHAIGSEASMDAAKIDTQKLADTLSLQEKSAMLLNDFFGDYFFKDKKAFNFDKTTDEVKEAYRVLANTPSAFPLKEFGPDCPHVLVPPNIFKLNVDFFKGEAPEFPIPTSGRLVLAADFSPFAVNILKKSAVKNGKSISVLLPGEVATAPKPGANECQIVLSPSSEDLKKNIDWKLVDLLVPVWNDNSVPAFGWSPELVAAIQVRKEQTPEEACKTAGIENPKPEFLAQLSNPVHTVVEAPAAPVAPVETLAAPEDTISDPDDLSETL